MADKKKKLSEFQNRKRKAEEEKSLSKISGSFLKYLSNRNEDAEFQTLEQQASVASEISNVEIEFFSHAENSELQPSISGGRSDQSTSTDMEAGTSIEILRKDYSDDPATWTVINDDLRLDVVKLGPTQVKDFDFPLDTNRTKFSCVHYKHRLVNGESLERNWLTYSIQKNSVFCFCCTLFPDSSLQLGIIKRSALGTDGVNDWKNISAILASHEKSKDHMISFQKWKELENRLKMKKTIDEEHLRKIEEQEKYWHQILERLIALVRVLGTQNLAFRGSNDALFASNNGNFLKFVEYLAMFDPVMCEHIRKIRDKEIHAHYLGKTIQNEMIQLLSNGIQEKILDDVKTAKYFSVVLDCTSDVSHVEQMTIIVRFVSPSEDKKFEIKEHFLGFIPVSDTTGGGLTAAVLNKFEELSLSVDNLRGQGYDNGSNMKGKKHWTTKTNFGHKPTCILCAL
ncbi:zinc finger MYM-type protein 5-like [Phyllobates terribilis]|uniref:zinc finger MYM-type protein 5-like n=1 Tax=Phyllobates terribilis TaxID=111132 RepID=UPI003CCA739A